MIRYPIIMTVASTATALLFSCSGENNNCTANAREAGVSANVRARELRLNGAPASVYMPLQEQAVKELRDGISADDPVDVLSQMGYFLTRTGDYLHAIEYLQEATDSLDGRRHNRDIHGDITLYGNLANLYARLDMTDEALATNSKAIATSKANGNVLLSDLYHFRGSIHNSAGHTDSMLVYTRRAIAAIDSTPINSSRQELTDFYLQNMYISLVENRKDYPDSLDNAIKALEKIEKGTESCSTSRFAIGLGYVEKGNPGKGLPMMEAATREFEEQQWGESIHWAYKLLIETYSRLGMSDKAAALYPGYNRLNDSIAACDRSNAVIAADIRYKASRKEAEIRQLNASLMSTRQRLYLLWTAITLAVAAVAAATWWIVKKNRHRRIHLNNRITELLASQEKLNSRLQTLVSEIDSGTIENAKGVLTPSLIKNDEVGKFRRTFETLHHEWLSRLREKAPGLTPNDELLCMLLYLKQTPEEISQCLGITRMSVNSARYRVRTKLGVPKETDLDSFVQNL